MPPSLRDWVPEDHLVWTVLDAVERDGSGGVLCGVSADGHGRPAYEPSMMVGAVAVRVCAREPVVARDRAGVPWRTSPIG